MTDHRQPLQSFRAGAVRASVWLNNGSEDRPFLTVTIGRSYKDGNDEWNETNSFGRDDLPKVRLVSDQAYGYIFSKTQEMNKEEGTPGFAEKERQRRSQEPAKAEQGKGGK